VKVEPVHADAVVADPDAQHGLLSLNLIDVHLYAAFAGELVGVAHEVEDDLS
jgi:hypothetical protein